MAKGQGKNTKGKRYGSACFSPFVFIRYLFALAYTQFLMVCLVGRSKSYSTTGVHFESTKEIHLEPFASVPCFAVVKIRQAKEKKSACLV